jgi:hypothetical protein
VQICRVNSLTQVFNIKKNSETVMLGSCSNNKGIVSVGGDMLHLYEKEKNSMYLSNTTLRTYFSFNDSSIQFVDTNNTIKHYKDKPISLPSGLNISYKTTFIPDPQNPLEVLTYYNKSLIITNSHCAHNQVLVGIIEFNFPGTLNLV